MNRPPPISPLFPPPPFSLSPRRAAQKGPPPPLFEPQQDWSVRTREAAQQAERKPVGRHVARVERKSQIGMQPPQLAAQRGGALGDRGLEPLEIAAQPPALQQRIVANGRGQSREPFHFGAVQAQCG